MLAWRHSFIGNFITKNVIVWANRVLPLELWYGYDFIHFQPFHAIILDANFPKHIFSPSDWDVLFTTVASYQPDVGLDSRLSCTNINATDGLWCILKIIWCEHRRSSESEFKVSIILHAIAQWTKFHITNFRPILKSGNLSFKYVFFFRCEENTIGNHSNDFAGLYYAYTIFITSTHFYAKKTLIQRKLRCSVSIETSLCVVWIGTMIENSNW